ncbi:hypothetical protein LOTGIDRAFT_157678 [Lottia gigantea]|uniref:Uncharacterized protein n=1 Tax=Lottia gigantea TaxID=225164 RepID=V4AZD4_LOTGI|nr:hypothetical protein LOTGIDRAFT_157678 [Lottia gigantea]ESP00471.1 hypothetical protein LOTGIDRAFT_157678 [Lottia gigantea]
MTSFVWLRRANGGCGFNSRSACDSPTTLKSSLIIPVDPEVNGMKITLMLLVVAVMMMGLEAHSTHVHVRVRRGWLWGKRDVKGADFDAAYNAAAEDDVFTDDEIKSVFGVDVDEFKAAYDLNGKYQSMIIHNDIIFTDDGVVKVLEYELVNKVNQDE